ncbi:uncharacterized protein F4822DRAFT_423922 [Hypoxylon trugodes]|uniref:uncharacterized protein n=1 Tax=Hypoxylon trugodes TaxID=326681 RepID=UPI00218E6E21|nr:uncharacterized protein F4822DRAFT_423922 [Hypoxylon trugodes]KAI1393453.1 hypothetical protein F4822DRAFT_423922 [Hypoxylon trugodes]
MPLKDALLGFKIQRELRLLPPHSVIMLYTTYKGEWCNGVLGKRFREALPAAYDCFQDICTVHNAQMNPDNMVDRLAGTCHLIPPQPGDGSNSRLPPLYVACIFVSPKDGPRCEITNSGPRNKPAESLRQIGFGLAQMKDLLDQEAAAGRTNWSSSGRNMLVYAEGPNSTDFDVQSAQVSSMIRHRFIDGPWEGTWWKTGRVPGW